MNVLPKKEKGKIKRNRGKSHFTLKGIHLVGCLFLFYMMSCQHNNLKQQIKHIKPTLKNGDFIVRNGNDEVSEAARQFNRIDKSYSHCGIIQIEKDTVFVYHALGGIFNPSQKLLRQPLEDFCNVKGTDKIAIFRYTLTSIQTDQLRKIIKHYYASGLQFDLYFNLFTDDKMYCSEFVFKCINRAKEGALNKLLHKNIEPLYISIDDLYLNKEVVKVTEIKF